MTINHPSFVGFDRLFSELDRLSHVKTSHQFPPHNIIKLSDNSYVLELAVAGYSREDLEVELENNVLTIRTSDAFKSYDDEVEFLHKGISNKKFVRKFTLSDNMEVTNVLLEDGILSVNMALKVPDELKPKLLQIN